MMLLAHGRRFLASSVKGCINSMSLKKAGLFGLRSLSDMSDQSFWNTFYASRQGNTHFDWFVRFEDVSEHLEPYLPLVRNSDIIRILEIGCGTSDFSLKLFEHLNRKCRIDCIDFSHEAIKVLRKIIDERSFLANETFGAEERLGISLDWTGLACHQADAKKLPFKDKTFSLAFDKGTSDAVLKGPDGESAFQDVVRECLRVLKPCGKLIQFSDEPPELRLSALENIRKDLIQSHSTTLNSCKLRLSWRTLETPSSFQHFLYVIHKENVD